MTDKKTKQIVTGDSEPVSGYEIQLKEEGQMADYERRTARQFEIARELGIAEGHRQVSDLLSYTSAYRWAAIKKTKDYRGLVIPGEFGAPVKINTWKEFCTHAIRRPVRTVDAVLQAFSEIGREGYEALTKIGVNQAAMKRLARLPKNESEPRIAEILENLHDPEFVKEVLEDGFKQDKNKIERVEAERDDALADVAAKDLVIEDEKALVGKLQMDEARRKSLPQIEALKETRTEISLSTISVMTSVQGLRTGIRMMREIAGDQLWVSQLCKTRIYEVYDQLDDLIMEFGLPAYQSNILESLLAQADSVGTALDDVTKSNSTETVQDTNISPFPGMPGTKQ